MDPQRLERGPKIGSGAFATVYLCHDRATGKAYATKIVRLDACKDKIETFQKEVALLGECRSPYIVSYFGSHVYGHDLWIVMEYLAAGSVLKLMRSAGPLPEAACALVLHDALEGLAYLHAQGHIHMDIKPGNMLLTLEGRGKLCDLGVAKGLTAAQMADAAAGTASAAESKPTKMAGTLLYMSPEMVQQHPIACNTDIWSLGITAIEVATGRVPRGELHQMKAIYMTAHHMPPTLEGKFSSSFKQFVEVCLVKDPKERSQAAVLLKHKFVKGVTKCSKLTALIKKSVSSPVDYSSSESESDGDSDRGHSEDDWEFDD